MLKNWPPEYVPQVYEKLFHPSETIIVLDSHHFASTHMNKSGFSIVRFSSQHSSRSSQIMQ